MKSGGKATVPRRMSRDHASGTPDMNQRHELQRQVPMKKPGTQAPGFPAETVKNLAPAQTPNCKGYTSAQQRESGRLGHRA